VNLRYRLTVLGVEGEPTHNITAIGDPLAESYSLEVLDELYIGTTSHRAVLRRITEKDPLKGKERFIAEFIPSGAVGPDY
jgi:hypothetical protein